MQFSKLKFAILTLTLACIFPVSASAYTITFAAAGGTVLHGFGTDIQDVAQGFDTVGGITNGSLSIDFQLYNGNGGSSGSTKVFLYGDNAGVPDFSNLISSSSPVGNGSFPGTSCGATTNFTMSSVTLSASTRYWFVVRNSVPYATDAIVSCGQTAGGSGNGLEGVVSPSGVGGTYSSDGGGAGMWHQVVLTDGASTSTANSTTTDSTTAETTNVILMLALCLALFVFLVR